MVKDDCWLTIKGLELCQHQVTKLLQVYRFVSGVIGMGIASYVYRYV